MSRSGLTWVRNRCEATGKLKREENVRDLVDEALREYIERHE